MRSRWLRTTEPYLLHQKLLKGDKPYTEIYEKIKHLRSPALWHLTIERAHKATIGMSAIWKLYMEMKKRHTVPDQYTYALMCCIMADKPVLKNKDRLNAIYNKVGMMNTVVLNTYTHALIKNDMMDSYLGIISHLSKHTPDFPLPLIDVAPLQKVSLTPHVFKVGFNGISQSHDTAHFNYLYHILSHHGFKMHYDLRVKFAINDCVVKGIPSIDTSAIQHHFPSPSSQTHEATE